MNDDKNQQYEKSLNIKKTAKRISITILCCLPFLILFGYFTINKISDVAMIAIFILFMGIVILVEELIANKIANKPKVEHKDVFK